MDALPLDTPVRPYNRYSSDTSAPSHSRESAISLGGFFDPPRRDEKILPKFDFILPKFYFILPKFYFGPPWGIFVSS